MTTPIDGDRLLGDLYTLRKIGEYKTGVHRPTYSPEDVQSRHWLAARMTEAGLEPEIDGIGNVIGRARGDGPKLLLGSHVETQPHAGWLDGALGVIYGLEVARTLGSGIDVAAWADEEGHFGSFIGSRSFCGLLPEAEIDRCHNREGTTLRDALEQAGFAGRPRAYRAGRGTGGYRQAHRHCHRDRRQPSIPYRVRGCAESCGHHAHGDPQGCRRCAGEAGRGNL
jgi:N-carbamoyl-L-amino-acid hydrolase